jgi:hypothetical protein
MQNVLSFWARVRCTLGVSTVAWSVPPSRDSTRVADHDVPNDRWPVPARVQRPLLLFRVHDGYDFVPLDASAFHPCQVSDSLGHIRYGEFHRGLSLHAHLQ